MNNNPLVSVIIASYNSGQYITKCLDSLLNQTYKNIEIIVCDDMSTDDSVDVVLEMSQNHSNIILLRNNENLRAAATRNKCIAEAHGVFYAIQDADDFSDPERIRKQVLYLQNHPDVDFVSSMAYTFSDNLYEKKGVMKFGEELPSKWSFLIGPPFIHPATMFRAECIKAVNGYRVAKETRRGQDYDMFMRMYSIAKKGANLMEPLYWYRLDDNTIKRHGKSGSHDEYLVRLNGFKAMGLMPIGYIFALKPYLANLIHRFGWFKY